MSEENILPRSIKQIFISHWTALVKAISMGAIDMDVISKNVHDNIPPYTFERAC